MYATWKSRTVRSLLPGAESSIDHLEIPTVAIEHPTINVHDEAYARTSDWPAAKQMKIAPTNTMIANKIVPQNVPNLLNTTPVTSLLTHSAMLEKATTFAATSAEAPAVENKMLKKLTPTIAIPPSKNIENTNK